MQEYRGSILAGCRIAFSSSVPINGEPSANFYWRRATSFGAVCQIGYDGPPTHIITSQAGEQDSLALKRNPGIRMVNMDWLLQSAKKFEKQDESLFAVRPVPVSAAALQAYAAPPPVAPPQSYPPQVAPPQSYPPQVVPPQSYPPPAAPPQSQSYPYYGTDYTAQGYPPYHNPALMSSTTTTTTYYQNQTQSMHQPYTNNAHPPPPREDDYNTWAALAKFVASDPTGKIPANDIKRFYNTVPIAKMVLGGGGNGGSLKSRIEQYGAAHGLQWENDGRAGLIAGGEQKYKTSLELETAGAACQEGDRGGKGTRSTGRSACHAVRPEDQRWRPEIHKEENWSRSSAASFPGSSSSGSCGRSCSTRSSFVSLLWRLVKNKRRNDAKGACRLSFEHTNHKKERGTCAWIYKTTDSLTGYRQRTSTAKFKVRFAF